MTVSRTLGILSVAALAAACPLLASCGSSSAGGATVQPDAECSAPIDAALDATPLPSLAEMTACDGQGQCTLAMIGCCGTCHENGLDALQAIRVGQEDSFSAYTCAPPPPSPCGSTGVACSCGRAAIPSPYVFASCVQHTCSGIDLRDGAWNECASDDDCELCVLASMQQLFTIARAQSDAFDLAKCGVVGCHACPAAAPGTYPYSHAACDPSTHRCKVTFVPPDAGADG